MAISAKQVNELRKLTGAGMMDCKKALVEAEGDIQKAIEALRKKGQKVSAKRADRETSEGAVFSSINEDQSQGIMFSLNCETDFVAKNEDFLGLGNNILAVAVETKAADKDALLAAKAADGRTVQDIIVEAIGKTGEKIEIGTYFVLEATKVVAYTHFNSKLGVLVGLNKAGGEEIYEAGKDVGMQVAAMNPVAVDQSGVDQDVVKREMELGREKAVAEGKPEHILDRIAEGYVKKFYQEHTLLAQKFVKDNSLTVKDYLNSVESGLTVTTFNRVAIG